MNESPVITALKRYRKELDSAQAQVARLKELCGDIWNRFEGNYVAGDRDSEWAERNKLEQRLKDEEVKI